MHSKLLKTRALLGLWNFAPIYYDAPQQCAFLKILLSLYVKLICRVLSVPLDICHVSISMTYSALGNLDVAISTVHFCSCMYRADTHRAVLEASKRKLTELMKKLSPDSLQLLLTFSFPYVGVPELRDIPLAVLGQLQPVPPDFLTQLATDKELFADLPSTVQIQV